MTQCRDIEQQHQMLQRAMTAVQNDLLRGESPTLKISATLRNQEIQALTLIALELRQLRDVIQYGHE